MTIKQGIKLSAICDKLDLKIDDPKGDQSKIGADLLMMVLKNAHKAEKEIYSFIAEVKKVTVAEAEEIDLVAFAKEFSDTAGLTDFFKSSVKSNNQD
jgi:hypothetical protein